MPPRKYPRKPKVSGKKYRPARNYRMVRMLNPQPIFTETYELTGSGPGQPGVQVLPNTGGVFRFNMDHLPQLAQYTSLYQKYRILKASIHILPEYTGVEQNQAENNFALSRSNFGQSRMALAVNNSPNTANPANELAVLQDNGSFVRSLTTAGIKATCRPVPNVSVDSLTPGVAGQPITLGRKFLNLQAVNGNIDHYGISWWLSQLVQTGTPSTKNLGIVYVKLTFQLSDPR